jgi:hypothetical protein
MRYWEAQMGDARFEVIPEACHCAVMLAAVVGHDAGGKFTCNRTARRLISCSHTCLELRPYFLRNFAGEVAHAMRQTALARSTHKADLNRLDDACAPSEVMSSGSFSPRIFILDRPIAARSAQGVFRIQ